MLHIGEANQHEDHGTYFHHEHWEAGLHNYWQPRLPNDQKIGSIRGKAKERFFEACNELGNRAALPTKLSQTLLKEKAG